MVIVDAAGPFRAGSDLALPDDGRRVYMPEDFQRYAPRTALDMLQQVPGFVIRLQAQERGLGQATGNVLINGQRMSGKSNEVTAELGRIPASNVVRIEIVDGVHAGCFRPQRPGRQRHGQGRAHQWTLCLEAGDSGLITPIRA
jgi:hypothetical protein